MSYIQMDLPWLLAVVIAALALYGLFRLILRMREFTRLLMIMGGASPDPSLLQEKLSYYTNQADQEALEIVNQKVRRVWRSRSPVRWLDINVLREECVVLVQNIAKVYYPSSQRPEMEVTVLELLKLSEKISKEVSALLRPFPILHKVSVSTIVETKNLYEQTKDILDKKGLRSGATVANRVYLMLNALNPQYWINKAVFKGASEVIGRKILTSIFRIVGTEAMRVYSTSAAVRMDPSVLLQVKKEVMERSVFENASGPVIPSPDPIPILPEPEENPYGIVDLEEGEEIELAELIPLEEEAAIRVEDLVEPEEGVEKKSLKERAYLSIAEYLSKFIEGSINLWDKSVNRESIFSAYRKRGVEVNELEDIRRLPVEQVDALAGRYQRYGSWLTAAEGAATGLGGIFMLAADAVSLLALQLRVIQQIGYCYGFDVSRPEEKMFAVKLLAEGYMHPDRRERSTVIEEMRYAASLMKGDQPLGLLKNRFFVYGFTKVSQKIGLRLGSQKTAQIIPFLGAAAGGYINQRVTRLIAEVAKEVYHDRLLRLQEEMPVENRP